MESFDIKVKKYRKKDEEIFSDEETDDGSYISDEEQEKYEGDEEQEVLLKYLSEAFYGIATVESTGFREFDVIFHHPNVELIEDEENYEFDIIDDVPTLSDARYFIPFVNFMKKHELALTGVSLYTNLEGGGSLII